MDFFTTFTLTLTLSLAFLTTTRVTSLHISTTNTNPCTSPCSTDADAVASDLVAVQKRLRDLLDLENEEDPAVSAFPAYRCALYCADQLDPPIRTVAHRLGFARALSKRGFDVEAVSQLRAARHSPGVAANVRFEAVLATLEATAWTCVEPDAPELEQFPALLRCV